MKFRTLDLDLVPAENGLDNVAEFPTKEMQEPVKTLVIVPAEQLVLQEFVEVGDISVQVDAGHKASVRG
ncbi:MAG: hypothetical protein WBY44_14220 [Bryobacteraceae bacterium]